VRAEKGPVRLGGPFGLSVALHLTVLALALIAVRKGPPEAMPPIYKVNIIAAPPGERAIGEVKPEPTPVEKTPAAPVAPPTPQERAVPLARVIPKKAASRATPVPQAAKPVPKTAAPRAGGGPEGGAGTDVATVQTEGIDFPFPGYLNNIVRQIALNFKPSDSNAALRADVKFLIYRNGSVKILHFVTRSGSYSFDLEAQGSIESAAPNFGPLPDGFHDDVLPVTFRFDPRIIR
jgi:periplasmic protein TonB